MLRSRLSVLVIVGDMFLMHGAFAEDAQQWGSIRGQFVLRGEIRAYKAPDIRAIKDGKVCWEAVVKRHDLVVDKKSNGIANLFVYMKSATTIHPKLQQPPATPALIRYQNCLIEPRASIVRCRQPIVLENKDPVVHNPVWRPLKNSGPGGLLLVPKARLEVKGLPFREPLPFEMTCRFHTFQKGHMLVLDHPYGAVTSADGKFVIKDLPTGTHRFFVWHEAAGYVERRLLVTVVGGETVEVPPITVDVKRFVPLAN